MPADDSGDMAPNWQARQLIADWRFRSPWWFSGTRKPNCQLQHDQPYFRTSVSLCYTANMLSNLLRNFWSLRGIFAWNQITFVMFLAVELGKAKPWGRHRLHWKARTLGQSQVARATGKNLFEDREIRDFNPHGVKIKVLTRALCWFSYSKKTCKWLVNHSELPRHSLVRFTTFKQRAGRWERNNSASLPFCEKYNWNNLHDLYFLLKDGWRRGYGKEFRSSKIGFWCMTHIISDLFEDCFASLVYLNEHINVQ